MNVQFYGMNTTSRFYNIELVSAFCSRVCAHACVIHVHSAAECVCMHVFCTCVVRPMLCAFVHELDRHELVRRRVYMRGCMRLVHVWLLAWLSILPPYPFIRHACRSRLTI